MDATKVIETTSPNPKPKPRPFSWSYSALKNFETCPRRYQAYNVTREVREPESEAISLGNALHQAFELRISKGLPLPLGMGMHEPWLAQFADMPGEIYTERKLALDVDFSPVSWQSPKAWYRGVLDLTNIRGESGQAVVVDYKTGKVQEDDTQLKLAAALVFAHDDRVMRVKSALWFVNYEYMYPLEFVREDVTEIWSDILPRVRAVERARATNDYPPKPGGLCRRWCAVSSCPFHGK